MKHVTQLVFLPLDQRDNRFVMYDYVSSVYRTLFEREDQNIFENISEMPSAFSDLTSALCYIWVWNCPAVVLIHLMQPSDRSQKFWHLLLLL